MKNIQGTLLYVRKRSYSRNHPTPIESGIISVFYDERLRNVDLPFGSPVVLIDMKEKAVDTFLWHSAKRKVLSFNPFKSKSQNEVPVKPVKKKTQVTMTVLHGDKIVSGILSKSQIKKWFVTSEVWNKHYEDKMEMVLTEEEGPNK